MEAFPCTLIQGYGQTEGTTMCFLSQEDHIRAIKEDYHPERLKACGREGLVTSVRVVDDDGIGTTTTRPTRSIIPAMPGVGVFKCIVRRPIRSTAMSGPIR